MAAGVMAGCALQQVGVVGFSFVIKVDPADVERARSRMGELLERRGAIYENLRDLRFEHRAGKFSAADYADTLASLEQEAARVIAEIETLTGSAPSVKTRRARASETK